MRSLLPDRYSPLQPNGNGLQSEYLTEVPQPLAEALIGLIGREVEPIALAATEIKPVPADDLDAWEGKLEQLVVADDTIPETDRLALVRARKGQGVFRDRVAQIEKRCRITNVENAAHLVASHCKPWRDATSGVERGVRNPTVTVVAQIAEALGVGPDQLLRPIK